MRVAPRVQTENREKEEKKKDEMKRKKMKLNRQEYANADIVVSPAVRQGSFEGHSSYASRVTKRREGRDPLRAYLRGGTQGKNKPWRFANGRPQIDKFRNRRKMDRKEKENLIKKSPEFYSATWENCGECWAAPKITSKLG